MNRTPWYPPHIKPKRVGWYEVNDGFPGVRYWWDGYMWYMRRGDFPLYFQDRIKWRGLTAPHGEKNGS